MERVLNVLKNKPSFSWGIGAGYVILLAVAKWQLHPPLGAIWYLLGGLLGIMILDIAEELFSLKPSPFRSVVFAWAFVVVAGFIVTSSDALMGKGLVLSLYLTLVLWQTREWQARSDLSSWYRMINGTVSRAWQKWLLVGFVGVFVVLSLLFVR